MNARPAHGILCRVALAGLMEGRFEGRWSSSCYAGTKETRGTPRETSGTLSAVVQLLQIRESNPVRTWFMRLVTLEMETSSPPTIATSQVMLASPDSKQRNERAGFDKNAWTGGGCGQAHKLLYQACSMDDSRYGLHTSHVYFLDQLVCGMFTLNELPNMQAVFTSVYQSPARRVVR